jgi:hypothetical protein
MLWQIALRFRRVRGTSLGAAVVADVCRINSVSNGTRWRFSSAKGDAGESTGPRCGSARTSTTGIASIRAAAAARDSTAVTKQRAGVNVSRVRSSASVKLASRGAAAVTRIIPSNVVRSSGPSGIATATISPLSTPSPRRSRAMLSMRSSNSEKVSGSFPGEKIAGASRFSREIRANSSRHELR